MKNYILLLNESIKKHVESLPKSQKARLKEKFEFLENGIWDSGLVVKKIKGLSGKVVFEARVDKGNRLLFTMGKHKDSAAIYIWGITSHDDINKNASVIIPENAPFLTFQADDIFSNETFSFDELPEDSYTQENIEEKCGDDYGPQKWLIFSEDERCRLLDSERKDLSLPLLLTGDQESILEKKPPVLLSGTAGSGKTTISIYYLLAHNFRNKRKIYLTYSSFLKKFSENLYNGLIVESNIADDNLPDFCVFKDLLLKISAGSGKVFNPQKEIGFHNFLPMINGLSLASKFSAELLWEEIHSIIKGAKPPISIAVFKKLLNSYKNRCLSRYEISELKNYISDLNAFEFFAKIEHFLKKKTRFKDINHLNSAIDDSEYLYTHDVEIVLLEIMEILSKRLNTFESPLLSFNEYSLIGKKRAPNFLFNRNDIYSIAECYQNKLFKEDLWDSADLAREVIKILDRKEHGYIYDLVVCDEIQDFSDIEMHVLFRLASDLRNIVFAGDPRQIINPSSFRWEEVKDKFFEKGYSVPSVTGLNLNFRSVGGIIKLSNALLDLKQRIVGLSGNEMKEDWKFSGMMPVVLYGLSDHDFSKLVSFNAGMAVITRDEESSRKAKKLFNTELIFTINEAKGLEFDTVVIWRFMSNNQSVKLWKDIARENADTTERQSQIKHEINLLYVAVTRCRNNLVFFDGEKVSELWDLREIREKAAISSDSKIPAEIFSVSSTPKEWEDQGDYFFDRRFYSAALECFKNAGNQQKILLCDAYKDYYNQKFDSAGDIFFEAKVFDKAAECYEKTKRFYDAYLLWKNIGNTEQAEFCRIKHLETENNFAEAADAWQILGKTDNMLECCEKGKLYDRLAKYYKKCKNFENTVKYYDLAGDIDNAVSYMITNKKFLQAADYLYEKKKYSDASVIYKKLKNFEKLELCLKKSNDDYNLGMFYVTIKKTDPAITHLKNSIVNNTVTKDAIIISADENNRKKKFQTAAILYAAADEFDKAGDAFINCNNFEHAIDMFSKSSNYYRLHVLYLKKYDYYNAARYLELSGNYDNLSQVKLYYKRYLFPIGKMVSSHADVLYKEATALLKKGELDKAYLRYSLIKYKEGMKSIIDQRPFNKKGLKFYIKNVPDVNQLFCDTKLFSLDPNEAAKVIISSPKKIQFREIMNFGEKKNIDVYAKIFLYIKDNVDDLTKIELRVAIKILIDSEYYSSTDVTENILEVMDYLKSFDSIFLLNNSVSKYVNNKNENSKGEDKKVYLNFLKRKIAENNNSFYNALYYLFINDLDKYNNALSELSVTDDNILIFYKSKHRKRVIKYYVNQKNDILQAACIAEKIGLFKKSGKLFVRLNNFKKAAAAYKKGKLYSEAAECYEKINNISSAAMCYEYSKNYKKALELYRILGNKKKIISITEIINIDDGQENSLFSK